MYHIFYKNGYSTYLLITVMCSISRLPMISLITHFNFSLVAEKGINILVC